jgi:MFS superfamily sulfate permease-like transporter
MSSPQPQSGIQQLKSVLRYDALSSVVVFLVALPLCMGIAIASGASVAAGLVTGIVGGIIVGLLAGAPLQVSGPAAGLTVIVYQAIETHGIEMLGLIVLIAGAIQIGAGAARLAQWFRAVSPAVIKGMLTGIGVLIFASQFHVMVDDKPKGSGLSNLASIPDAIGKGLGLPQLASREERDFRTRALKDLGELHRRQLELGVRVAEGLHDHKQTGSTPEKTEQRLHADQNAIAALAAEQSEIARRLNELTAQIDEFAVDPEHHLSAALGTSQAAQRSLEVALEDLHAGHTTTAIASQQAAAASLSNVLDSLKSHHIAALIGVCTIVLLLGWQGFAPRTMKIIPAPLIAIVLATSATALLSLPVLYVEIPDKPLANLHIITPTLLSDVPWAGVLQTALVVAVVASAETLLCAVAVDQLHTGPRTRFDRELAAQGFGNVVCGFLGALPMTGVIVRSAANVQAGARSRWSAVLHGVWLLIFVVWLSAILRLVPTAGLAAILVYTGYKLINPKTFKDLARYGKGEVFVYTATVVVIVAVDLLAGVLTGVVLSGLKLLYTFSHLKIRVTEESPHRINLSLEGAATFMRLPKLAETLEAVPSDAELHIDVSRLNYIDHACLDLITNWAKQHEASGGRLQVDWDSMHARFRKSPSEPRQEAALRRSA